MTSPLDVMDVRENPCGSGSTARMKFETRRHFRAPVMGNACSNPAVASVIARA